MKSKRRTYGGGGGGSHVLKNIAGRAVAHIVADRIINGPYNRRSRRRSRRRIRDSPTPKKTQRRRSNSPQKENRDDTKMTIAKIAAVSALTIGAYAYFYGERKVKFGPSSGTLEVNGNLINRHLLVEGNNTYDYNRIVLTKYGNTLIISEKDKNDEREQLKAYDFLKYQVSGYTGMYYKFGNNNMPYFYVDYDNYKKVIDFLKT